MYEKIRAMHARFHELEADLGRPEIAGDPATLKRLLREHGSLRRVAEVFERYLKTQETIAAADELLAESDDPEFIEYAELEQREARSTLEALDAELRDLLLSADEDDDKDVIMDIQAGTGGDEAAIFVGDLLRMYQRLADARGWNLEVLEATPSNAGGFKQVTAGISGPGVHRELQFESGGHRVQRVPATESQGRIHTSLATVVVMPEVEEVELEIPDADIKEQNFCASGPGGQHVNKTESAVRLIHLPTNIKVECQDEKSQHMNRVRARRILLSRVADHFRQIREAEIGAKRRSLRGSGDRSQRIRTYNFPQNRLTDHRINLTIYSLDKAIEGELDELIEALLESHKQHKLESLSGGATA